MEVVKMFLRHVSYPLRPDKITGSLTIEDVLGSDFNIGKRDDLIKCLVIEGGSRTNVGVFRYGSAKSE